MAPTIDLSLGAEPCQGVFPALPTYNYGGGRTRSKSSDGPTRRAVDPGHAGGMQEDHPSGAPIVKPCKFAVKPVCDHRATADGKKCPAHVHAKAGLTAPLTRVQAAPVGRMARMSSALQDTLPRGQPLTRRCQQQRELGIGMGGPTCSIRSTCRPGA
jgi:hypothetical protein